MAELFSIQIRSACHLKGIYILNCDKNKLLFTSVAMDRKWFEKSN